MRLEQAAGRAEQLAQEAQLHAAGDEAIPCSGGRVFPVKLSDTALYVTDMQGDFLLPHGRIGKHYSAKDLAAMEPVIENSKRLAGITIVYGRSHRFGAEIRRDLVCAHDSDDT
jgi:hypothetical protein